MRQTWQKYMEILFAFTSFATLRINKYVEEIWFSLGQYANPSLQLTKMLKNHEFLLWLDANVFIFVLLLCVIQLQILFCSTLQLIAPFRISKQSHISSFIMTVDDNFIFVKKIGSRSTYYTHLHYCTSLGVVLYWDEFFRILIYALL